MKYFTHSLCAFLVTLLLCLVANAEQGVLWVSVTNPQGDPIPNVVLSVAGASSTSPPTANSGLTRIKLGSDTKVGSEVALVVVRAPANLVLISPWDRHLTVPCFEQDSACTAKVVLAERGSRLLVEYGEAAKAMLYLFTLRQSTGQRDRSQISHEQWKQALLVEVAAYFGLTPAEVDRAIRDWKPTAKDKRAEGLQKLYEGKPAEARSLFSESKRQRKADLAEDTFLEGWAYESSGKYRDAIDSYREALGYRPDDSRVMYRLGLSYDIVGESELAEKYLKQARESYEKTLGPVSLEVAACAAMLAAVYYNRGDLERGVPLMERAVTIRQQLKGRDYPAITHDLANVAIGYISLGKFEVAEELLRRARRIAEDRGDSASVELSYVLNAQGPIYFKIGDLKETERVFKRSLDVLRKYFAKSADKEKARQEGAYNYAQAAGFLGHIYKQQGRFDKAEPLLREALEYEELEGPLLPSDVERLDSLADLYVKQGNFAAVEKLVVQSLTIMEPALGKEHANVVERVKLLALIYEMQKRFPEAEQLMARVMQTAEKGGPEGLVDELLEHAKYYERRGRQSEAEACFNRAAALAEKVAREHPETAVRVTQSLRRFCEKRTDSICRAQEPLLRER